MRPVLPAPRLLPATTAVIAVLLAVKCAGLVRAAIPAADAPATAVVATAQASQAPPASQTSSAAKTPPIAAPSPSHAAAEPAAPSEAERTILQELRQRRQELDKREAALASRESMLAAAETKLAVRVDELIALQKKLEALEAERRKREDSGWQGLVKTYEAMKPRDAALIFNDLSQPVLLEVLDRMKEVKAAPVLAAMNPDRAREITAQLADLRTRRNTTAPEPGGTASSEKKAAN
jgi:flagellar motility protein MotE (MotC chaperone)